MDESSIKVVYEGKYFEITEEEFTTPDKSKHKHSNVYRKPISVIFPMQGNKIFLISQFRRFFNERILEAVAGHVNDREDPLDAAKRELREETGIKAERWNKIAEVEMSASVVRSTVHLYVANDLKFGKAAMESGEDISIVEISVEDAVEKVFSGEIKTASSIIGILMIDKIKAEGKI